MQKLSFYLILTFSFLLQGASEWDRYYKEQNQCPLEKAVIRRDLDAVIDIIASGKTTWSKLNDLMRIAIRNNDIEILKRLMRYRIYTPIDSKLIFLTLYKDSDEALKLLIPYVDINIEENGYTALHYAAQYHDQDFN